MMNNSGLQVGMTVSSHHSKYHPFHALVMNYHYERQVCVDGLRAMGRVNIQQQIVPYVDVWNTTNTSGFGTKTTRIIAATHSSQRCQQIEPSLRVVNSWAKTTINLGV
jgi:hypothetical protein